jgi:acetyl esterase/lipase
VFDVYIPPHVKHAPVLFMVHGGGWDSGDKANSASVLNKMQYWTARGYVFISTNYRLLPQADVSQQAQDVAFAISQAQAHAPAWGADPNRFILMGHSAGAHLVSLVMASPALLKLAKVKPWLGAVVLDSGAMNVLQLMREPHGALYDKAFGTNAANWEKNSPVQRLATKLPPVLAVCSIPRGSDCLQAQQFIDKQKSLGGQGAVLREQMNHYNINHLLGKEPAYTTAVDQFMQGLIAQAPTASGSVTR